MGELQEVQDRKEEGEEEERIEKKGKRMYTNRVDQGKRKKESRHYYSPNR